MPGNAKNKPNEIYISRVYDAPLKTVWDAWTIPEQKAHWWGPRGFTITTHSSDIRTGGTWDYTMHGPDGTDYPNVTKFLEVTKHSRMVYDHGGTHDKPALFRVTVEFSEQNGKTKMEMVMALATEEAARETKKFIKKAGGDGTWDRLAEYISPTDNFVINRSFDAPKEKLFEMWANPDHLAQWMGPTGTEMKMIEADIRPGGTIFYSMGVPGMPKMFGKIHYKELTRPDRLVYTQVFCEENGKISRHPMAPTWPETMLTTVVFASEGENRSRVTITWEVYGEATKAERDTFHNAKAGMTQGWTGSFDKLEEYLAT